MTGLCLNVDGCSNDTWTRARKELVRQLVAAHRLATLTSAGEVGKTRLTDYLRDKQWQLILDNCEHLVEAA